MAPGVIFAIFFLVVPVACILYVSFYTFDGINMSPPVAAGDYFRNGGANYSEIFLSPAYSASLLVTLRLAIIVTLMCLVIAYPISYLQAMHIKKDENKLLVTLLLLVPWWIDYTIRSMAWLPILGREGLVNSVLLALGILKSPTDAFIFNEFSAIMVMIQGNLLFMSGPIFFSLAKIQRNVLEAAETLGASKARAFYNIVFKMSKPGVVIGIIFVFVSVMADYATPRLIGGIMIPIGLNIVGLVGVLNLPLASAISMILVMLTFVLIAIALRIVDIKQMIF